MFTNTWELNRSRMEDGQRLTDDSVTEIGGCTPVECRRKHNDGDTSSDGEHVEPAGIATDNPQRTTEGAGMADGENTDVYEESISEFSDEDVEEGDGIQDMSQLGTGAVVVKFQTVHQQSYQLVDKDTKSLVQHIVGYCQPPQGEIASALHPQQQLQRVSGGDGEERTDQTHLSTSTTSVGPGTTSLQVPGTAALTPASTSTTCVGPGTTSLQVPGTVALTAASTSTTSVGPGTTRLQVPGTVALTAASTSTTNVGPGTTSLQVPGTAALTPASISATSVGPGTTSLHVPGRAALTPASSSTTSVGPGTTCLQVPGTAALTPASTLSLLPSIPGSLVSQIQSSGLPEVPMTGDIPAGATLCSFVKVEQHFGDVTVTGGKNLNIGGTQNVGTTPTNREEEEKPLTAAQKIWKRTTSRIQSWTKDMVETDALKKVKEKLDRGATWVTIKGRPGEGKSTIAYMTLKNLHSQERQVFQVVSPEEFNEVTTACANPVIMLDDIFGDLEFATAEWNKWRQSLRPIVDVKHPDTDAEKDVIDVSTKTEKVSERTKVDQRQVKRTSPNEDKTIIILIGRDYVLKSSLADLGRMADYISSPQYVVEVSSQRASYEQRKIWRVHAETKNINFDESTVSMICKADCPHGFPHVCKMFMAAYEKDWTHLQMQMFFQAPLDFLRNTLDKLLKDKIKRSLFMAMIKRDGKISGQDLENDDDRSYERRAAADDMVGSYLKKEEDTYMFDHPSIYDCVSFILSTNQSKFVIENCSLSFINQRLRLAPSTEREKNVAGETDLVANIPWTYAKLLSSRFATEIKRRNLLHVLSHQAFCNSDFVNLLMECLKTRFHMRVSDIVKLTDNSSNKSFCELLSRNKSHHLIKYIMETEHISFTQSEGRDILLGVCTDAACEILKYISGHMKLEINATYGYKETTPLMLAAETRDSEFVNQILSLDPDLNARDKMDVTVFGYLCENGLTSAVEHAINMGVEVNQQHGYFREHPLYIAIEKGHLDVVKLLVNRGCDIDNERGLRHTVRSLNANMVRYFLDRGAVVDGFVVCRACKAGNRDIVEMLFEKGATVDMVSPDGETPLFSSCQGNPTVVSYLLKKGASITQASNVTGDTPLHVAASWGSTECVYVLLKAGAHVYVQNNTGDTPLHGAAGRGSTECVDVLLKVGADVNVQNDTGDTPLHGAAAGEWRSAECVDVLLKAGADVNVQNNKGDTPLHGAAVWGSTECVDVLLKAGADVNVQNNTGDTPLHGAAGRGSTECVDVLLKAGAHVNVQNNKGDTPLHTTAVRGPTECVDVLLEAGADVNVQNKTGDTPLHEAAGRGSTERVDVLLKAGADVNVQNNTGDTPLHRAAGRRSTECVDVLLKAGAHVNVQNNTGDTPLHTAAVERGSTECVDVLLKAGADVNVQNNTGDTPLHTTAGQGYTECVDVLLKAGADVNVQNNTGDTPLHGAAAAKRGSTEVVDLLLKAGAHVNVQNNTGDTSLHTAAAAERRSTERVDVLLKAGAHVNVQNNTGDTPLHTTAASVRGSTECVDVLLKAGAHVNVQNNTGDTPLHGAAAVVWGCTVCVDVLLKAGVHVNARFTTGETPLQTAAAAVRGSTERVDLLLKAGANVNLQNNTGDTPLHTAAAVWGSTERVDMLLKAGAHVNVRNNKGDTPLLGAAAAVWGSTECVDVLPKAGAHVNVLNSTGNTPLLGAAAEVWGSTECVDVLLKAGADVNVQNNTGNTPLRIAAGSRNTEFVGVLLKAGADVNAQNNTGDTPLHEAASWGSTKCVDVLLKAGADVNVQNNTGNTPLHRAAVGELASTECVDVLLKAGADVNVQNNTGDTPLHGAAV